jgi:predicted phosphodiesterase
VAHGFTPVERADIIIAMRIAALYDVHGNLPAFEAVMAEVRASKVDRIVIGGDLLPGPMPRECLHMALALDLPTDFIIGNGDRESVAANRGTMSRTIPDFFREAMRWNGAQLTPADENVIESWPLTLRTTVEGIGEVLFCHATPRNDIEIFLKTTAEEKLKPIVDPLGVQLVVCGHTHMQFDRMVGNTRIVNAGSIGLPFQKAGAYWALIGPGVELRRTDYDLEAAATRVRQTAYPQAEYAANGILNPPDEQATLEQFKNAELQ